MNLVKIICYYHYFCFNILFTHSCINFMPIRLAEPVIIILIAAAMLRIDPLSASCRCVLNSAKSLVVDVFEWH